MSAYERGQILTSADLNWYTTINDVLTNAYEISYQIFDIVDDQLVGTQIFPVVDDTWEEVTTTGRFSTGCYYAYDNSEAVGFQIPLDARIGNHRIKWRWKASVSGPYSYGNEDFSVVSALTGGGDTYVSVNDIREAGITVDIISDDSVILAAIRLWQDVLDRCCRQWFLPRLLTIGFDGDNSMTIHLGVPCIEVEYLRINGSTTDLDTTLYEVYGNNTDLPSRRRNPKIALVQNVPRDIHIAPFYEGQMKFLKGYKNQTLKGTFGFVESDLSPPRAIQRALIKLVIEKLTNPIYPGADDPEPASPSFAGIVVEERTDGHSLKYGSADYGKRKSGLIGITGDPEIHDIIKLYRGPIGIATPSHWMGVV